MHQDHRRGGKGKSAVQVLPKEEQRVNASFKAEIHESIIPLPEQMKGYSEIDPEFPRTIMSWTSDQLAHQRKMQSMTIWFKFVEQLFNNIFGIIAICIPAYVGYLFMKNGYALQGSAIICTISVAIAGIFVIRKISNFNTQNKKPAKPEE